MTKPLDVSKFRKNITKSISGISTGFNDPDTWISTGSYALNYLISGDFYKGVPMGKVTMFAGESGSGKSFIAAGNIIKNAQEQGIFVVLIDTENGADLSWLQALGVDTSDDKLLKISASMIDDIAKIISDFVNDYKKDYADLPKDQKPKVLFVIDSLGMALSSVEVNQFAAGEIKGDMGRKPKQLKALVTNCVNMFGSLDIGLVCTNHTYASQDMFNPDPVISGGSGFVYAASIVVAMQKLKLKEDEDGNKISDVVGIRAVCKVVKSRYAKPFETVKINIPYETGMNPISGLFDLFEKTGKFTKQGNRYKYTCKDGTEMLYFRKEWNDFNKMKVVMDEFSQDDLGNSMPDEDTSVDEFSIIEDGLE
jgi:RecA/RadA recombinase